MNKGIRKNTLHGQARSKYAPKGQTPKQPHRSNQLQKQPTTKATPPK